MGDSTTDLPPSPGSVGHLTKVYILYLVKLPVFYYPHGSSLGVVGISGNLAKKMTPGGED